MTDFSPLELFERFEGDIEFDCHGLVARICRSEAGKEIVRRGKSIIPDLGSFFENAPTGDLERAWAAIIRDLWRQHRFHLIKWPETDRGWIDLVRAASLAVWLETAK